MVDKPRPYTLEEARRYAGEDTVRRDEMVTNPDAWATLQWRRHAGAQWETGAQLYRANAYSRGQNLLKRLQEGGMPDAQVRVKRTQYVSVESCD